MTETTQQHTPPTLVDDGFLVACQELVEKHSADDSASMARYANEGLTQRLEVFAGSTEPESHNLDFDTIEQEWSPAPGVLEDCFHMLVFPNGSSQMVGEDSFCMSPKFKQPFELVEFIRFYRNTVAHVQEPVVWTRRSLREIFPRVGLRWIREMEKPVVLPLTQETLQNLDQSLQEELFIHLREDVDSAMEHSVHLGLDFCQKHNDEVLPLCEPLPEAGFGWSRQGLWPAYQTPEVAGISFISISLEPDPEVLSCSWFHEFYESGATELVDALRTVFNHARSIEDLDRLLNETSIETPGNPIQQTRLAVETRETTRWCNEELQYLLRTEANSRKVLSHRHAWLLRLMEVNEDNAK